METLGSPFHIRVILVGYLNGVTLYFSLYLHTHVLNTYGLPTIYSYLYFSNPINKSDQVNITF